MERENLKISEMRNSDEIDLLLVAKTLYDRKKLILSITFSFFILGLLVALLSPKEFTATSTFIPKTSESSKVGSLGGLASLAGINLGQAAAGADIPPSLYPKFASSVSFKRALLNAEIEIGEDKQKVTYKEYYEDIVKPSVFDLVKNYTIGLPGILLSTLRKESIPSTQENIDSAIIHIGPEENSHFARLDGQLTIETSDKDGLIKLSFKMPEPLMAAQMAKFAEELLQKKIIEFKLQSASEQLLFTQQRFVEKKKEFEDAQARLAYFRDRNQNLSSATVMNQLQKLESDYSFAFNIYNELASQLEQAKFQVAKDTPVLSVIEPVTVPSEKSAPKRSLIIIIFSVLGLIIAVGYVFGSEFIKGVRNQWIKL